MRKPVTLLIVALLLGLSASAVHAKTAAELLREGLYAEEVDGNLDAAIGIYQQIILDDSAPKNLVAQALYRQGMCFRKNRQEQKARNVFETLVTKYGDQTGVVEKVIPLLAEMGNADPASLMPPETIVYIEIGSPGRQIETMLNMLKDMPVENALAAMGQIPGGQAGPAAMIRGLLNPAMLTEMKKIRGLGLGITELAGKTPSGIIVLFPGESDALRGMLQMALTGFGKAASPVDGMQMFTFPQGGGAAFDDTVVIAATPSPNGMEMLRQAVRQYKGQASGVSLGSSNKAFMNISKQARQQNALTLWVNVDETYERVTKMLPPDQIPMQLHMANGVVNFQNVDDLIATLSLRETGVALDANLNFRDGTKSMFYNLIHTPNLSKEALKAIPAEAIGLISFTLGGADTAQAQTVGGKIKEATGMDLGSQIFGNIEQITLFAAPPKDMIAASNSPIPPAAQSIGLAITSKNTQQTQQLLTTMLQMAELLPAETDAASSIPATGRFDLSVANDMKFFGYTDETSRTMVLSPNSQVVGASLTAMEQNRSVVSAGKLQDALETLSPQTSKLVLVNVAGLLQLAEQNMEFPSDEMAQEARQSIDELIRASEKATVRLLTSEKDNSFSVRLSASDLPPVGEVMGPAMQLAQMMEQARASMDMTKGQAARAISITQASRAPAIDGKADEVWAGAESHAIDNVAYSALAGVEDLSASFKTMYDSEALYLLVEVADDELMNDSAESWLDDGIEIFIDADNGKAETFGENDYQFSLSWDRSAPSLEETKHSKTSGVQYAFARTDGSSGYRAEIKLPWSTLGVQGAVGNRIGLDVHVNDDDDGGNRDTKLMWHTTSDVAWQHPNAFGTGELAGLVGWWKLDEATGTVAADSSGNGHGLTAHGDPTWQPQGGKVGGAVALDGDGDYFEVADESAFDFTSGLTVAAWIKANSLDKPWQAIVTKGEWSWRIQRNEETSMLEFACSGVHVPGESPYGPLYGTREIAMGEWHHVAGTYNGKRMCLYIDGALDTAQAAWGSIQMDDDPVLIGENAGERNRFWNGQIDDVRVYNFGLAQAQIQQLYNEGR